METSFSEDFKKFFLEEFTKELIIHSSTQDIVRLRKLIELKEKKKREKIFHVPERKEFLAGQPEIETLPKRISVKPKAAVGQIRKQVVRQVPKSLFIPEQKLPEHLEYLKPIPSANVEIDLWKLNPLIKDPAVRIIEANPDEKVTVTGNMGTKQTGITMNKEDIDRVINKFSELSKIPTNEGVYKVAVGNLILSAIISEVIGSKFIIRKMAYAPQPQFSQMPKNNLRK